ncbi:hypothetical protein ACMFMG_006033 [Clarireedia jacksonii]
MSKPVLITGATGKQGGAVVEALSAKPSKEFLVLAVTRDTNSNLDDVTTLFQDAKRVAGSAIWGVYSVQISMGKGVTKESEIRQGTTLVDESLKNGVKHFVYSSVDRGGDEKSWKNATPIPHFQTKHQIEHHLKDKAGDKMGWTILRPVAFMDNLQPGFQTSVFVTALRDTLNDKPLQWVATSDIGKFAAKAFKQPDRWNHKAVGLAGDELTVSQLSDSFNEAIGRPAATTYSFFGSALKWAVPEMGTMLNWFADEGYGANIAALKKEEPGLLDMKTWLKQKSAFTT